MVTYEYNDSASNELNDNAIEKLLKNPWPTLVVLNLCSSFNNSRR